jgi:hypothetical protein
MIESWFGKALNKVVFDSLARRLNTVERRGNSVAYFNKLRQDYKQSDGLLNISYGLFSAIDTKTAALLTHISILIAVVSIFYSTLDNGAFVIKSLLIIEAIVYLTATIICLRCIRFDLPAVDGDQTHEQQIYHEITDRRALYTLSLDITVAATAVLILIFIIHWFIGPSSSLHPGVERSGTV